MGQGFRATMHEVVQEGLSYLTFIVEKSLLEFSPKNLSKERMGKWWIHQPSRILLSCTTNTQFLWILRVANVPDITDMSNCQFKETVSLGLYWGKTIVAFICDVPAFRISTRHSPIQIVHESIFIFDVPCGQPKSSNFCWDRVYPQFSHFDHLFKSGAFPDKI